VLAGFLGLRGSNARKAEPKLSRRTVDDRRQSFIIGGIQIDVPTSLERKLVPLILEPRPFKDSGNKADRCGWADGSDFSHA
jgi:hypothetical protein